MGQGAGARAVASGPGAAITEPEALDSQPGEQAPIEGLASSARPERHKISAEPDPDPGPRQPPDHDGQPVPAPDPLWEGPAASAARPARLRWRRRATGPFYAALDLGTNNCRLLIAEPRGDSFRVVDSFSRIVRLGEGVSQTGALKPDAMERALAALQVCRQKISVRAVSGARLIATEACRQAANGSAFLARVRDEVGLELEVIDRRTEAHLAVLGCSTLLDPAATGAVLFDIGGGSTEIVWVDRRRHPRRRGLVRAWVSIPVGVVTLAERHGGRVVDEAIFERMVADVQREFGRFRAREALRATMRGGRFHLLGTSGTVTTLAGVFLGLPRYDRRCVDGLWMEDGDIERMMQTLRAMDYEARIANPCIGRERADLVLAGCAIFEAIRREWPCNRLRVADRGLREGILVQLMRADGLLRRRQGRRLDRPPASAP